MLAWMLAWQRCYFDAYCPTSAQCEAQGLQNRVLVGRRFYRTEGFVSAATAACGKGDACWGSLCAIIS